MGSLKALTIASALAIAAVQSAQAADLLPPPPPIEAPPLRGPIEESGFYMRVDAGVSNTYASGLRSTYGDGTTPAADNVVDGVANVGDPAILGLGFGYQVNNWLRTDITGEYRSAIAYQANANWQAGTVAANSNNFPGCPVGSTISCTDTYAGTIKTGLVLANAYLDMGTWYGVTPYVGAGVGAAIYQVSGMKDVTTFADSLSVPASGNSGIWNAWGYAPNHTGVNLAWAGMVGAAYHITPNLLLDVSYRYVNMGTFATGVIGCNNSAASSGCHLETQHFNMAANDLRVGLRWQMAAAPVYFDPGVRAKY